MMKTNYFVFLGLFVQTMVAAQSPEWWAENVQWDGVRPWHYYIPLNAGHMGPNALPIPEMHQIQTDTTSWVLGGLTYHGRKGEGTVSSLLGVQWKPSPWVRMMITVVPVEYFETSHELKEERKIFFLAYDDQWAGGDFHLSSNVTVPTAWLGGIQAELRVGLRAPSGTKLGAARYTDAPGYHFDLAFSRRWTERHSWEVMTGFLAYQTYSDKYHQNDAFLWGIGHAIHYPQWTLTHAIRGYNGYIGGGDRPMVYQLTSAWTTVQNRWRWELTGGIGLNDYPFTYVGISCRRLFNLLLPVGIRNVL